MDILGKHTFKDVPELDSGDKLNGVHESVSAPTVNDDSSNGYYKGYSWIDTTNGVSYTCVDDSVGAASWLKGKIEDGNGTTANSTSVNLGGELTEALTLIDATTVNVEGVAFGLLTALGSWYINSNNQTRTGNDGGTNSFTETLSSVLYDLSVDGNISIQSRKTGNLGLYKTGGASFVLNDNNEIILTATNGGIKEAGDYSANYTDLSLVNKAYVDNRASSNMTSTFKFKSVVAEPVSPVPDGEMHFDVTTSILYMSIHDLNGLRNHQIVIGKMDAYTGLDIVLTTGQWDDITDNLSFGSIISDYGITGSDFVKVEVEWVTPPSIFSNDQVVNITLSTNTAKNTIKDELSAFSFDSNSDAKLYTYYNAGAGNATLNTDKAPIGSKFKLAQTGAGAATIVAGVGVNVIGKTVTTGLGDTITIERITDDGYGLTGEVYLCS